MDRLLEDREIGAQARRVELRAAVSRPRGHGTPGGGVSRRHRYPERDAQAAPARRSLCSLALAAAGCGGGEKASDTNLPGDAEAGKQVFADAGCGGCHTLRAANATGAKGPNLDTVGPGYQRVVEQVTDGGPAMPSFEFKLGKDEIRNVAAFVAESTGGGLEGQPVAGKFEPNDKKLEDCKGDFACFEQAYGNLAFYDGPEVALKRFEAGDRASRAPSRATATGSPTRSARPRCRASRARSARPSRRAPRPAGRATTTASSSGRSWTSRTPSCPAASRGMCDDADLRSGPTFTLYQCVHGLGHGLMIYTRYDMPRSLKVCDALNGSWDQTSCTGGVFMENLSSSYGVKSKWLRDDDLIYPCNTVAERHKIYCYLMVTSRILPTNGYNFAKASKALPHEREGLDRDLLPVARPRRLGQQPPEPRPDPEVLRDGREHDERLRLRRRARHVEQLRGRQGGLGALHEVAEGASARAASRASGRSSAGSTRPPRRGGRRAPRSRRSTAAVCSRGAGA